MKFRVIDTGSNDGFYNMAADEALMKISKDPVLRLYSWEPACVTVGYFQNIDDIDLDFCKKNNIDVVRRITGGKALLHDKELTYSFIIDEDKLPKSVVESYKIISRPILSSLQELGINAKFKNQEVVKTESPVCLANPSWYEIIVERKKIAAAAQVRKNRKLLQHGPILLDIDFEMMSLIFTHKDKSLQSLMKEKITCVEHYNNQINIEKLKKIILKRFKENFKYEFYNDELNDEEKVLIQNLKINKYNSKKWNCRL